MIKAPNTAYNGQIGNVVFKDGRAETDDKAVITYCRGAGYEVDGEVDNPTARPRFTGDSSRTHQALGTPLRDAATDPRPGDFLPPIGAGQADPHGPTVVSPEIHAAPGPTPIVPGPVLDDPKAQEQRESAAAEQTLIAQKPAGEVFHGLAQSDQERPAGNASQEAWADWVIATHSGLEKRKINSMSRNDLRDKYGA